MSKREGKGSSGCSASPSKKKAARTFLLSFTQIVSTVAARLLAHCAERGPFGTTLMCATEYDSVSIRGAQMTFFARVRKDVRTCFYGSAIKAMVGLSSPSL